MPQSNREEIQKEANAGRKSTGVLGDATSNCQDGKAARENPAQAEIALDSVSPVCEGSNHHQSFESPVLPISKKRTRAGKKGFRTFRAQIVWRHFLYRVRKPRHANVAGMFLLLLDPVQYELAPLLHPDKATNFRQKLAHALVKRVLYKGLEPALFSPSPEALENAAVVVEKWSRSARSCQEVKF